MASMTMMTTVIWPLMTTTKASASAQESTFCRLAPGMVLVVKCCKGCSLFPDKPPTLPDYFHPNG